MFPEPRSAGTGEADPTGWPSLYELFADQADRAPDSVAIRMGGQSLTYADLAGRANRLARLLIERGVGPDVIVPILLERSPTAVVALLGVAAAGGCFLSLDPDAPYTRNSLMLEDSGAPLVLTSTEHRPLMSRLGSTAAVYLDDPEIEMRMSEMSADRVGDAERHEPLRPHHLAFVVFSSGSTGTPKGAANTQAGIVNCLQWMTEEIGLGARETALHHTSLLFDVAIVEIFLPLINGGRLVVLPAGEQADTSAIAARIRIESVSLAFFVATALAVFLEDPHASECSGLRNIVVAGEALSGALQARCHETFPKTTLWNGYGPSETSVLVTLWRCRREDGNATPPIGWACPGTNLLVLKEDLTIADHGDLGELHIAGVPVSRGYLRRPELTAERFLPCPRPYRGTMYRTGDMVRLRPDGALEFHGRSDRQIKLNGVRIEPGEVEAALADLPGIAHAAVTARDVSGKMRLIAYLIAQKGTSATNSGILRGALADRLPSAMIPSAFIFLDTFPLTPSGKLAVRELPDPQPHVDESHESIPVAPRNDAERVLASIWSDVLGLESVGVRDSFFNLGGDSILAIRVARRAQQAGFELSVRNLFSADTIEAQAVLRNDTEIAVVNTDLVADTGSGGGTSGQSPYESSHPSESEFTADETYALTAVQQGMLFHSLLDPGSGDYVEQVVGAIESSDPDRVAAIWVGSLMRHAALRTSVELRTGEPVAIVHRDVTPDVRHLDWTDLDEAARGAALAALLEYDRSEDFNPLRPPLWRLYVVRQSADVVRFVWSYHHLILDGWSLTLALNEIGRALQAGDERTPVPAPVSPRDYVEWLARQDMAAALAFWRAELEGVHDGTGLGLPVPDQEAGRRGRGRVTRRIDRHAIDRFCRAQRVTTATVLQAAVALLLRRYASTCDVVFGSAVSGRAIDLDGVESVVGNLLYLVPVRVDVCDGALVGPWLRSLQGRQATAQEFGYVPLTELQREAVVVDGHELIKVLVNFEEYHLGGDGHVLRDVEVLDAAHVPLIASFSGDAESLELRLAYDRSLFFDEAVEQVSRHLVRLVVELVADAGRPLGTLEMLGADERRTLLEDFNATAAPTGSEPIHDIIGHGMGERVALIAGEQAITYTELDTQANRLAYALRELGARPGHRVALCMQRSPQLVAAMLGVLRAGAAYVPLDPDHPPQRRCFMLRDSGASIVVVDKNGRTALSRDSGTVSVLDVDADASAIACRPCERPDVAVSLDDVAYVMYTSGSTGEPKAVAQTHRTIRNMFDWIVGRYGLGPSDRWLFKTPVTFDVSVPDVFFPLAVGADIVIAPPGAHSDPAALIDLITEHDVRVVQFVPSMLEAFLDDPRAAQCVSLRYVLAAGEKLSRGVADRFRAVLPGVRLHNLYGPTETFYVTDHHCDGDRPHDPPIGHPIANTYAYVVDDRGQPLPAGATGELWIGGAGLAQGYLHHDRLTAEGFLPNPFRSGPGERVYRTGDLARWNFSGELEYLGRRDDQVKINGQRVEIGEVEAAINGHPDVLRAAVAVHPGADGRQRLVGYLVGIGDHPLDHGEIAEAIREQLPRAYVPSMWVNLDSLPVTVNGKLDRSALPAPATRAAGEVDDRPATALEKILCALWGDLLEMGVSRHDDVFAAGADSMSCVRAVARARSQGVELDVKIVVAQPTPAGQASAIENRRDHVVGQQAPTAMPVLFMFPGMSMAGSAALARIGIACRDIADATVVGYPDWEVICREQLELDDIAASFADEIRLEMSRRAPGAPVLLAGYSLGGAVAYCVGLHLERLGQPIAYLGILDSEPPSPTAEWSESPRSDSATVTRARRVRRRFKQLSNLVDIDWLGYKFAHAPTPLLRYAPVFARTLTGEQRARFGNRVNVHVMAPVTLRWLREKARMVEHVDIPISLFRQRCSAETEGWAQRGTSLDTVVVAGDHGSMLLGENLVQLSDRFRDSLLTSLASPWCDAGSANAGAASSPAARARRRPPEPRR